MSIVAPDYRLLWLRRLDALWLVRPAADSFWAAKPLFREMRGVIGDAYDQDASGDALWALVTEGLVFAVETEDDHVLQIRAAGRAELAALEGPPA